MSDNAILSEYKSIRDEINQLNTQIITAFSFVLSGNLIILGWMFSKENSQDYLYLLIISFILLIFGNIIIISRNRLAHRLALFQKYFIETRLTDIYWARVYFDYRETYKKSSMCYFIINIFERLSDVFCWFLNILSLLNLIIIFLYNINCKLQWFVFLVGLSVFIVQLLMNILINRYKKIEDVFKILNKKYLKK
jgi:hypothetical protein